MNYDLFTSFCTLAWSNLYCVFLGNKDTRCRHPLHLGVMLFRAELWSQEGEWSWLEIRPNLRLNPSLAPPRNSVCDESPFLSQTSHENRVVGSTLWGCYVESLTWGSARGNLIEAPWDSGSWQQAEVVPSTGLGSEKPCLLLSGEVDSWLCCRNRKWGRPPENPAFLWQSAGSRFRTMWTG